MLNGNDAELDQQELDDPQTSQDLATKSMSAPTNADIANLFGQAKQDIDQNRSQGLNQDDIKKLSQHQAAGSFVNMFMNMVGAANNVSAKPYTDVLNQGLANEKENLGLKDQIASKGLQRALTEQNLGMNQLRANQALNEQQVLDAPVNTLQKGTIAALVKLGKIDPKSVNFDNMTVRQYQQVMGDLEKLGSLNIQQQRIAQEQADRGWQHLQNPDGTVYLKNVLTGKEIHPNVVASDANKNYEYPDLISSTSPLGKAQLQDVKSNIPKIQNEASKLLTQENEYNNNLDTMKMMIKQARDKGNYVAANNLSAREAQTFDNMNQKLSNMVLQMQANGISGGAVNAAQSYTQRMMGHGKLTYSDAEKMLDLADQVDELKKQYFEKQKEDLRSKTRSHIPSNINANIDSLTFGKPNVSGQAATPSKYISGDDYLKSLGGAK